MLLVPHSAAAQQSIVSSVSFSLSGGETVSHSFNLTPGETVTLMYTVSLTNATNCVEVSGQFGGAVDYNQTSSSKSFADIYSFSANLAGTQELTYSTCPNVPKCTEAGKFSVTYDTALALTPKPPDLWDQFSLALVVLLAGVTVLAVILGVLYLRKPSPGTLSPQVPSRF
jgi:hypothetical protein